MLRSLALHRRYAAIALAVGNLKLHKRRVLPAALALVVGVSSTIAMLAIAEGARTQARRQIGASGAVRIIVCDAAAGASIDTNFEPPNGGGLATPGLTDRDVERIMAIPTVQAATLGCSGLSQITVTVTAIEEVTRTAAAIDDLLSAAHGKKDFDIIVPRALIRHAEATQRSFSLILGSIASISFLVGGLGIMSVMLASVSERTREIGIRRALGARRRDIIEQFLIEATVVSCAGGLIGVLLGLAAPLAYSYVSGMPVLIRPWSPVVAFLTAVWIGITFGVYPARRAAMLEPAKALGAE